MRWLTESAMHRRRAMISADWKKKRGDSIGTAPSDVILTSAGRRVKATASFCYSLTYALRRPRLARDVLHDRHGAFADERDGHRVGADAVARDAGDDSNVSGGAVAAFSRHPRAPR